MNIFEKHTLFLHLFQNKSLKSKPIKKMLNNLFSRNNITILVLLAFFLHFSVESKAQKPSQDIPPRTVPVYLYVPSESVNKSLVNSGIGIETAFPKATFDVRGSLYVGSDAYNGFTIKTLPEVGTGPQKPVSLIGIPQRGFLVKDREDMDGGLWMIGGSYFDKRSEYGAIGAGLIGDGGTFNTTGTAASYIQFYEGNIVFAGKKNLTKGQLFYGDVSLFIDCGTRNVGIGTNNTGTYKLAVEGTMGARVVKVTQNAWADYVFADDFKLRNLSEVSNFIGKNRHLPDVPSEEEIKKNGLDVGEMQKIQMQKIEEITLYLIKQEKEINALKEENKELRKILKKRKL
jgi:hypothetical protein